MRRRRSVPEKDLLTTHDLARLLSVDMGTIVHWIEQGKLRAHRTPGGHRRIRKQDLILFLRGYDMPIPEELLAEEKIVVVVDDHKLTRSYIRQLVEKMVPGVRVAEESDGEDGWKRILELKPILVVLDVFLTGTDGIQICRRTRSDERLAGTRILAVTGSEDPAVKKRVMDAGADAFLRKPFQEEKFQDTAALLLGPVQHT